jgi:hypothetical protein
MADSEGKLLPVGDVLSRHQAHRSNGSDGRAARLDPVSEGSGDGLRQLPAVRTEAGPGADETRYHPLLEGSILLEPAPVDSPSRRIGDGSIKQANVDVIDFAHQLGHEVVYSNSGIVGAFLHHRHRSEMEAIILRDLETVFALYPRRLRLGH